MSSGSPWTCYKTLLDTEGRFAFDKGLLGEVRLTLATIYAPNDHQDVFVRHVLTKLLDFKEAKLILLGILMPPLTPTVDTSSGFSFVPTGSHKRIAQSLHKAQLMYGGYNIREKEITCSICLLIESTQEFIFS